MVGSMLKGKEALTCMIKMARIGAFVFTIYPYRSASHICGGVLRLTVKTAHNRFTEGNGHP